MIGLFGAVLLLLAASAQAQAPDDAAAWRAASRLGYLPTPALLQAIASHPRGARGWAADEVERAFAASRAPAKTPGQLATLRSSLPDSFAEFRAERQALRRVRDEGQAPPRPQDLPTRRAMREAATWRLLACSDPELENPLAARLTEFWFNHFNVFAGKGPVRPFVGHYVLHAIRPNVLGRFEDLVLATARHPAMLFYLDQAQSVAEGMTGPMGAARGLNENYARELMELHTLGADGGYAQGDVRELARILTGWTVDPASDSGFRFASRLHDRGDKTLLGRNFSADGEREGQEAIALLAGHPATAKRVSLRLAQWFVSDAPPAALVAQLAAEFRATGGDLRAVMLRLVAADAFWDPGQQLFKTPYDFACSALAATGQADSARLDLALGFLAGAGQPVHGWQTPDGYKTDARTWLAPEALTRRADFALALSRDAPVPGHYWRFLAPRTRERIAQEPPALHGMLVLASPEFMHK
jgi:uncharacterized protein (DUF1800 family)